jgi:hypothetical protein
MLHYTKSSLKSKGWLSSLGREVKRVSSLTRRAVVSKLATMVLGRGAGDSPDGGLPGVFIHRDDVAGCACGRAAR